MPGNLRVHAQGEGIDGLMSGEFIDLFAVAACGAVVTPTEAVTIPLLRRAAITDLIRAEAS